MYKMNLILVCVTLLAVPVLVFADGRTDYNAHCAACHGAHGKVQTEKAKALNMDVRRLSLKVSTMNRKEMTTVIEKGKGKMPGFKKELAPEQIAAIIDYVISLRKK